MLRKIFALIPYAVVIGITAALLMWPAPGERDESAGKETSPPVLSVKTTRVVREDLTDAFETTGTAESWAQVSVSPQLEGMLTQVEVETGTRVRAGQLLARL